MENIVSPFSRTNDKAATDMTINLEYWPISVIGKLSKDFVSH
jgi:hypothetical protein